MKKFILLLLFSVFIFAGCASIISGTRQKVYINSSPDGAQVFITNSYGVYVYSGATPLSWRLKRGNDYVVSIQMEGYEEQTVFIDRQFNGWFVGNILFGGPVGAVIDVIDGAMWRLDPDSIHFELVHTVSNGQELDYVVVGLKDNQNRLRTKAIPIVPTILQPDSNQ